MAKAIGITLPFSRGQIGYFQQSYDPLTQVKSNFINLVLTRKGERVMQPEFGCDLHKLVFSQFDAEYEANVKKAIQQAVQKWMPFLVINDLAVTRDDDYNKTLVQATISLQSNVSITESVTISF